MEHFDKFTFLFLTSFVSDRLERIAKVVEHSTMRGPPMFLNILQEFRSQEMAIRRFFGKRRDGVNSTLTSHTCKRANFSRRSDKIQVSVLQHICAHSTAPAIHGTFTEHIDFFFTTVLDKLDSAAPLFG